MIVMDDKRLYEYTTADKSVALSDKVNIIGERAFAHGRMPVKFVVIPPTVVEVEERAFDDCNEMFSIVIPNSVTKIGEKAFGYGIDGKIQGFCIYGEKGSEAERYAEKHGFRFAVLHENAPSFEDFTLSYYKTGKINHDLYHHISIYYDFKIPEISDEATRLINEALDIRCSDFQRAVRCLEDARYLYSTMHATEEQILGQEPEPPRSQEQDDALFQLAEIMHYVCHIHGAEAALNGDWQTVRDSYKKAHESIWIYHKPESEKDHHIKRIMFKALGLSSLMLGNPAEALYWYHEEFDSIRDICKIEDNYHNFAGCFERMSEAFLMYGYLEAAEYYCGLSIELRRLAINQAEKEAQQGADYKDYLDRRYKAYDQFRIALLQEDEWRMQFAQSLLKDCRNEAPMLSEEEKELITADIKRIEIIAKETKTKRRMKYQGD